MIKIAVCFRFLFRLWVEEQPSPSIRRGTFFRPIFFSILFPSIYPIKEGRPINHSDGITVSRGSYKHTHRTAGWSFGSLFRLRWEWRWWFLITAPKLNIQVSFIWRPSPSFHFTKLLSTTEGNDLRRWEKDIAVKWFSFANLIPFYWRWPNCAGTIWSWSNEFSLEDIESCVGRSQNAEYVNNYHAC